MTLNVEALNEVGRIFDWQPDPARYFATTATEQVRQGLQENLIAGDGVLVLMGEAGAGKTLLVRSVLQELPAHWAHIAQLTFTAMSGDEIATSIAYAFGMPPGPSVMSHQPPLQWMQTQLRVWASCGEASLLVVDEAQSLPADALHTLLLLSQLRQNEQPVLRVLLVGPPSLAPQLDNPTLAAHISPPFVVPRLTRAESAAYVQSRLAHYAGPALPVLTLPAVAEIHTRTQGLPGRINMLCQQLLHTAILLESHAPISAADVATQADELSYRADPLLPPAVASAPAVAFTPAAVPAVQSTRVAPTLQSTKLSRVPPTPHADVLAERHHPAPPRRARRIMATSVGALVMAVAAVTAFSTWFYTHRENPAHVTAKLPSAAPVAVSAGSPAPTAFPVPIEATPQALPATPTALQTPATSTAPEPARAQSPLEEKPHVPPIEKPVETITATATATASPSTEAPVSPPKAKPVTPAVEHNAVTANKANHERCNNLLAQMSLGEPLTPKQRRLLETQCR